MSIKHSTPIYYITDGGEGTSLVNGNTLSGNTLPVAAGTYLISVGSESFVVVLPDVIEMNGQFLTFVQIASNFESDFQVVAGTNGGGNASIDINSDNSYVFSTPGSLTLLADGLSGKWWVISSITPD